MPHPVNHPCAVCGRATSQWCSRFRNVWYCSPDHMRSARPHHREQCYQIATPPTVEPEYISTHAKLSLADEEPRTIINENNIFAVIVGINDYHNMGPPLEGAVNDARAFQKYLLDLGVPSSNIALILNGAATRANINSTIQSHLRDNPNIPNDGEAVKIFFAGHGSRTGAPQNLYAPEGQVEVICPVDERTMDAAGVYVHAIPDYVLRWLFWDIAAKSGPNNTVILDCCSAGGMDRDVGVYRTARYDSNPVPLELDNTLWKGQTDVVPHRMWSKAAKPYVVLAACRADQKAGEVQTDGAWGGRFTAHLLPLLQKAPLAHTAYTELMNVMPRKLRREQIPQCIGVNSNRPVFGGHHPATGQRSVLLVSQDHALKKRKFRVQMGMLEGVVCGTEFLVYDPTNNNSLCILMAKFVYDDYATLIGKDGESPQISPDLWARAKVSDWKSPPILIYAPDDFLYAADLFSAHATRSRKLSRAPSHEKADVVVRSEGGEIVIGRSTWMFPQVRFTLASHPAHLLEVIEGIDHFNYFLDGHNQKKPIKGIALEMHRLHGEYPARSPDASGNLVKDGEVRLTSEAGAAYGFTIHNNYHHDLFPYLFYFELQTRTIHPWYLPSSARVNAPLPSGGTVELGMGSDPAFDFTLAPGELSSSGFFKLFVTRKYVDLARMQQELSPFDPQFVGTGRLRTSDESLDFKSTKWDALTVKLTISAQTNGENA